MSGALERVSGAEYRIGTEVSCGVEVCGELSRVIIDPVARTLTDLVVASRHQPGEDHLVPIELVEETGQRIRLGCSESEFDALESAVETRFLPGLGDLSLHAIDGNIGRVQGLVIDPRDHHVTHLLLEEGHLWGKKEVAIPITTVTGIDDGVRINLTTDQVRDLPPVEISHRN